MKPLKSQRMRGLKSVVLLQHSWDVPQGYVGDVLDEYHIQHQVIDVESSAIPDLTQYAAVIALGGPQHVYQEDQHPYLTQEKVQLRRVVDENIPFLGICLGGQILASALNSQVRSHHITELGFFDVELTVEGQKDPLFNGLPGYQKVFHWHEDTFDLPHGATLLATSTNTENQAFRYGRCAYGLQYHIELSPTILDAWFYTADSRESMLSILGEGGYRILEQERLACTSTYYEHTRIMLENFLSISDII